jgi:hypothetical protein
MIKEDLLEEMNASILYISILILAMRSYSEVFPHEG